MHKQMPPLDATDQSQLERICNDQQIQQSVVQLPATTKPMAAAQLRLIETKEGRRFQSALDANELGFYPSIFCQLSLPVRRQPGSEYFRDSGNGYRLSIFTPARVGIPYGIYPRGILGFIAREITLNKHAGMTDPRVIELGESLGEFIEDLNGHETYSAGKRGTLTLLKQQLRSLVRSKIEFSHYRMDTDQEDSFTNYRFIHHGREMLQPHLWTPEVHEKSGKLVIRVDEDFYWDVAEHAAPFDQRVLKALWPSCLKVDIAYWVAYRANLIALDRRSIETSGSYKRLDVGWIPLSWKGLQAQFGAPYKANGSERVFKQRFKEAFDAVQEIYDPNDREAIRLVEHGSRLFLEAKRPMVPALSSADMDRLLMAQAARRHQRRMAPPASGRLFA